jgi:hypothetical protein
MLHARNKCLILERISDVKHFLLESFAWRLSEKVARDSRGQKPARRGRESGHECVMSGRLRGHPTTRDWTNQGNRKFSIDQASRAAAFWEFRSFLPATSWKLNASFGWTD